MLALLAAVQAAPAAASSTQEAIFQDDGLLSQNPAGAMATLRSLGVTRVRVAVAWSRIAPQPTAKQAPKGFNAGSPSAYPAANWSFFDQVVENAHANGISLDFLLTAPVPRWAEGRDKPAGDPFGAWKPSAADYGAFVKAIGTRYSGSYEPKGSSGPLPAVNFWGIWNEPNYGPDLAPQTASSGRVQLAAASYRGLLGHAWSALRASGHKRDTIVFGETAPHGYVSGGNFSGTAPLEFVRGLYCVNSHNQQLRGTLASQNGCPTTAAGSRRFRSQNPALFSSSAFAAHPYAEATPPNRSLLAKGQDHADVADLGAAGKLERTLDRLNRVYGSHKQFPVYSTEYGYQTNPPEHSQQGINPLTAAYYLNWAEYLSYKQSRIRSYAQYLLLDPPGGNFASGLEFSSGQPKPGLAAYRMPLYMPKTSVKHPTSLEVWGGVRPAHIAKLDTGQAQTARIQFQANSSGAFTTLKTVAITNLRGYFDVHQTFSHSGTVRVAWTDQSGQTDLSRSVTIKVG
ncbi:MAG: hypothetical protein M3Z06_15930 [Actinomycetota bacterium]|nr:hypothetical protein [Actinomycetota bacterium]